jgi:hypothetical protein
MSAEKPPSNDVQVFIEPPSNDPNDIIGPRSSTFLYSKCQSFLSVFKWFPVLFIAGVLVWGYYAYVVQLCIRKCITVVGMVFFLLIILSSGHATVTLESLWLQIPFVTVFHFLYIMCVWSYYQTIFTKPKPIPKQVRLTYLFLSFVLNSDKQSQSKLIVTLSFVISIG